MRGVTFMRNVNLTDQIVDAGWSVNSTIRCFPATVAVFNEFGVDACCGGAATLREAALEAGVALDQLLATLESAREATATSS